MFFVSYVKRLIKTLAVSCISGCIVYTAIKLYNSGCPRVRIRYKHGGLNKDVYIIWWMFKDQYIIYMKPDSTRGDACKGRYVIERNDSDNTFTLVICNAMFKDSGEYKCYVEYNNGSVLMCDFVVNVALREIGRIQPTVT
ncbi:putative immunoglobulin-like domain containing protein [Namao virus]|nr:putative immunoglobulin-like domain containing protein [Namao virus]